MQSISCVSCHVHGLTIVIPSSPIVMLYNGPLETDTKPTQDKLPRFCMEIFHENFFRALDNLTGFQSIHILP